MPSLSYRSRLFLALVAVSVIPVALMTGAGLVALRLVERQTTIPEITRVRETTLELNQSLVGTPLSPASTQAQFAHDNAVDSLLTRVRQGDNLASTYLPAGVVALLIALAIVLVFAVAIIVRLLSRQLAAPLDEVVRWTGQIKRREPLPAAAHDERTIREFATLRAALRDLAVSLEQKRAADLEAERLRTFGEVARRVAHEMKNPLTPIRLAVMQMRRNAPPESIEPLDVIAAESARLENMAREFAELGRLPEGVASPVDLRELLDEMLRATVPPPMTYLFECDEDAIVVSAHYDPLRRAFSNLLRNAVEACGSSGEVRVKLARGRDRIEIAISDTGTGIPAEKRDLIFEPYYTEKETGTGLGLAIVRQTIELHRGNIVVTDNPAGGATFVVSLPA